MTVENYDTGAENMATHETYLVEYHVLFSGDSDQRFNGSFQCEGAMPSKEQVLGNIVRENPDTDWSEAARGSYTVSRLMNNNVHIVEEQGAFTPAELSSAPGA
jgi:hypothetical protein